MQSRVRRGIRIGKCVEDLDNGHCTNEAEFGMIDWKKCYFSFDDNDDVFQTKRALLC